MMSPVIWICPEMFLFPLILLHFIATQLTVVMVPFLGLSLGLYYAVKTIRALKLAFSLSPLLDYPVSMVTWLLILLQSANQSLKTGFRSNARLRCLHSCRTCFYICFVISQPVERSAYLIWKETVPGLCERLLILYPFLHCGRNASETRWDRIAVSPHHHQEVFSLMGIHIEVIHLDILILQGCCL